MDVFALAQWCSLVSVMGAVIMGWWARPPPGSSHEGSRVMPQTMTRKPANKKRSKTGRPVGKVEPLNGGYVVRRVTVDRGELKVRFAGWFAREQDADALAIAIGQGEA